MAIFHNSAFSTITSMILLTPFMTCSPTWQLAVQIR